MTLTHSHSSGLAPWQAPGKQSPEERSRLDDYQGPGDDLGSYQKIANLESTYLL